MVYPFACLGTRTQDLKYRGGQPGVRIGDRTTLREYVTVNAATADGDTTRVGSDCQIMAYAHVAHDCRIEDHVIIANCGTLAGHVAMEDYSILGGLSGVHQFVRVGRMAIVGGCSKVTQDVPPYMMADGHPLSVRAINKVGLERRGFSEEAQRDIKAAFRILYRDGLATRDALEKIKVEIPQRAEVRHLVAFVEASSRGIAKK
jgi:UDP-N-acetylglucosamine acyltransferase